eukprot:TRINITY_DN8744_c0_g1_i1.p1 TRINITY_DN8744_c0_g1~~TRINITY_DN8744_c0_g1_i1.p1  ORF type:complete len:912 (-),score=203.65 TRINITY_DN8744_c0_g1_i1:58-2772(-)
MQATPRARKTQIGALLFGKPDYTPEEHKLAVQPRVLTPDTLKGTEQFLEAGLVFPKPLPWVEGPRLQQAEAINSRDAVYDSMNQRLASCERRLGLQETHAAELKKHEMELQRLREASELQIRSSTERFAVVEASVQQSQRDEATARGHLQTLQAEFREFASQSLRHQRFSQTEMDSRVGNALAKINVSDEEYRSAMRQKDAEAQIEVERLNNAIKDMQERLITSQSELRVRLSALEAPGRSVHQQGTFTAGADNTGSSYLGQAVDFLRQQVDQLYRNSSQSGASLADIRSRLDSEVAARAATLQDQGARLEALSQAFGASQSLIAQSIAQRVEVLEERLGIERREILARQAKLRDELSIDEHGKDLRMQNLSATLRAELESLEQRSKLEIDKLREHVDNEVVQLRAVLASEENASKAATAGLLQRVEGLFGLQNENMKTLKNEIDIRARNAQDAVSSENTARREGERRLFEEVRDAMQNALAGETIALQKALKQQADVVAAEFEQMRRVNADRADRISRYVDAALSDVGRGWQDQRGNDASAEGHRELMNRLNESVSDIQKQVDQQVTSLERRYDHFSDEVRSLLKKAADTQDREARAVRRDAEKAAASVERRSVANNEELKSRFEVYVRHFDNAIASVQAAIMRPALRDPHALGYLASSQARVQPDTKGDQQARGDANLFMAPSHSVQSQVQRGSNLFLAPSHSVQSQVQPGSNLFLAPAQSSQSRVQSGANEFLDPARVSTVANSRTSATPEEGKTRSRSAESSYLLAGQRADMLLADERVQQRATLEPQTAESADPVRLPARQTADTLLAHERVQQRVVLDAPSTSTADTGAYLRPAPWDPMDVHELRPAGEEAQASVAEQVLGNLFSGASTEPGALEIPELEAQGKPNRDSDNPSPEGTR